MKRARYWGVVALAVAAAGTFAKDYTDDVQDGTIAFGEITEDSTIAVPSGETVVSSSALTGSGSLTVTGGGRVTFTAESPAYSGAVTAVGSSLGVAASSALGTGPVTLSSSSGQSNAILVFSGDSALTFPNALTVANAADTVSISNLCTKCVTLEGAVTSSRALYIIDDQSIEGWYPSDVLHMSFLAPVTLTTKGSAGYLTVSSQGAVAFHDKVKTARFYAHGGGNRPHVTGGWIYLYSSENTITEYKSRWGGKVVACGENAVAGGTLTLENGQSGGIVLRGGCSQTLGKVDGSAKASEWDYIRAEGTAATLTLNGKGAATATRVLLNEELALTVDSSDGTLNQVFTAPKAHTMKGPLTVKSGTLTVRNGSLPNLSSIDISGGSLVLDEMDENALAGLKTLSLSGAGALTIQGAAASSALPNDGTLVLSLSGTPTLNLSDGTQLNVARLVIDGQQYARPPDVPYTHADFAAIPEGVSIVAAGMDRTFTESGDIQIGDLQATCFMTIPEGVSVTNTAAITGTGRISISGGGTLVLAAASPAFGGGFSVGLGELRVTVANALGTGEVEVQGKTGAQGISRVVFDVGNAVMTIPNDFHFLTAQSIDPIDSAGLCFVQPTGCLTFTGDLQAENGLCLAELTSFASRDYDRLRFTGSVVANGNFDIKARYRLSFFGSVSASRIYASGDAASPGATPYIYLYAQENEVGYLYNRKGGQLVCMTNDVLKAGYYRFGDTTTSGGLQLRTSDQTLTHLSTDSTSNSKGGFISASETGATLTLVGSSTAINATAKMTQLQGPLSLVVDQQGEAALVQTLRGAQHTMTGTLTVRRGTLNLMDGTTFANVPQVTISGGTLAISDTGDTFGNFADTQTVLHFAGDGRLNIADGVTVSIRLATVDGRHLLDGDYTGEGGPRTARVLPQLSGTGVLRVRCRKGTLIMFK